MLVNTNTARGSTNITIFIIYQISAIVIKVQYNYIKVYAPI